MVVVGAGGAARAVVWALLDAGVEKVLVANRTPERATDLAEHLSNYGMVEPTPLESRALAQALGSAAIAVNATAARPRIRVRFMISSLGLSCPAPPSKASREPPGATPGFWR